MKIKLTMLISIIVIGISANAQKYKYDNIMESNLRLGWSKTELIDATKGEKTSWDLSTLAKGYSTLKVDADNVLLGYSFYNDICTAQFVQTYDESVANMFGYFADKGVKIGDNTWVYQLKYLPIQGYYTEIRLDYSANSKTWMWMFRLKTYSN